MKKIAIIMSSALALVAFAFTSCDKRGTDVNEITEDGFYVKGPATGVDGVVSDNMMAAGINEADQQKLRSGMYEKYIALEANKEFTLAFYEAGTTVNYGAALETYDVSDKDANPTAVTVTRGQLVTGESAPAMKVTESGLYHIVLDLNKAGDLQYPQIIVTKVSWGVRGVNANWDWAEMTASEFSHKSMTWTISYDAVNTCDFKFSYGGGWKIDLDDAGKVKANTNLGVDSVPGGGNIDLQKGEKVTIKLTWTLAGGEIARSFKYEINAEKWLIEDPAKFVVGVSGACFGADANWSDPAGATAATYNAAESKVADEKSKDGTYVYDIKGLDFAAGEFKVRVNGGWFGAGNGVEIKGVEVTGEDNFTIAAGKYDLKFTVVWAKGKASKITVQFTAAK